MKKINARQFVMVSLLIADCIVISLAFITAYFLRDKGVFRLFLDQVQPIDTYLRALPFAIFFLIIVLACNGLYDAKKRLTPLSEMYGVIKTVTIWILLIMGGSYLTKYDYSRIIVVLFYGFSILFLMSERLCMRLLQTYFSSLGFGRTNILIVGTGKPAKEIAKRLERYASVGIYLVGFIGETKIDGRTLGSLKSLYTIIKKYDVDEVYIADPAISHEKILTLVAKCPSIKTTFKITSNIFGLIAGNVDLANLESIPSLDVSRIEFPLWKMVYKRAFDICFAIIGLVLTAPFWIVISIAIKLDSRGNALFRQTRVGLKGQLFKMYKFRTMGTKKNASITKVGKFLRSTSLDELPQLLNILKGDMSIVGPRPELPNLVRDYNLWEKRRLLVKPGLTGLWQILGRKDLPLVENMEYDFYYINNQSLILDLIIIVKTIPIVLLRKGAY